MKYTGWCQSDFNIHAPWLTSDAPVLAPISADWNFEAWRAHGAQGVGPSRPPSKALWWIIIQKR
jgi:hypothetical protein